ncbi:hypothetical protein [Emticicia sp. BO119]|uniref:hypothetical protein n=1 Tax=Emticicia sp. BO119 TaxID=2757768 RepID=UPI0015F01643|nr:hypothetical protein [Emticicia sp. BO119]MBA4850322.1 hypothetical protein [Emticicia sp. BO119]
MTAKINNSYLLLVRNILISIGTGSLIAYTNFHVKNGYLAMTIIALSSFLIGFLEPRRGWILALTQAAIAISFYYIKPIKPVDEDLAMFTSHVAVGQSLVFSFVAGALRRLYQKK